MRRHAQRAAVTLYPEGIVKAFFSPAGMLILLAAAGACSTGSGSGAPRIVQPGAPGEASKVIGADAARDLSKVGATAADVTFMQGMIHHHAQAIDMTELLKTRTGSDDMNFAAASLGAGNSTAGTPAPTGGGMRCHRDHARCRR